MLGLFHVYQQFPPVKLNEQDDDGNDLYAANLIKVGSVEATDGATAIKAAKQWSRFNILSGLGRFPVVELVTA